MDSRSTKSTVSFAHPFRIAGYDDELPRGEYEVVVDEDLLPGLSFEAYRRSGTYLLIGGQAGGRGPAEMRPIDPRDLETALALDQAKSERSWTSAGAASPEEDPS